MTKLAVIFLLTSATFAAEFRAGRAAVNINPPTGWPGGPAGIHDDLHAKALVFEKDGLKTAIVVCDLGVIQKDVVQAARLLIERENGIPPKNVMISATHVHSAFDLPIWWEWETAPPVMMEYRASLPAKIAAAVRQAHQDLQPVRVSAGIGHENSLSFNRRFLMKDGSARMNPGKRNPDIVRPLGPIDPDVMVAYIESLDGKPLATFVNFAMHLDTVGGKEVSADFPYTLSKLLAEAKGPGMLTIFGIGTAGNINHIDVSSAKPQKGHGEAARIGTVLAAEVLKTLEGMTPVEPASLRAAYEKVEFELPAIGAGDMERAEALRSRLKSSNKPSFLQQMWMQRILETAKRGGKPIETEVQAIAVGDQLAWVSLPSEVFVEIGLAIKRASPFPFTIVDTLASDWLRYTPNRKGYAEGAYEAINTRGAPGSGERLADAATRLLLELRTPYPGAFGSLPAK